MAFSDEFKRGFVIGNALAGMGNTFVNKVIINPDEPVIDEYFYLNSTDLSKTHLDFAETLIVPATIGYYSNAYEISGVLEKELEVTTNAMSDGSLIVSATIGYYSNTNEVSAMIALKELEEKTSNMRDGVLIVRGTDIGGN